MDEFSWEDAQIDEIEIPDYKKNKIAILMKILEIVNLIESLDMKFKYEREEDESDFNLINKILKLNSVEEQFIALKKSEIGAQLIFFIDERKILKNELQYVLFNQVENSKIRKFNGVVIAVDGYMEWKNLTSYFSRNPRFLKFVDEIMRCINLHKKKFDVYESMNIMQQYNFSIKEKIPTSRNMFRHHPLYILPSMLPKNYVIFPKRPLIGLFKGEQIFLKNNIKKLHDEKSLRKIGLQPKNFNEYFLEKNGEKFYLEIQAERLKLYGLKKQMDFFHENELPVDCSYFEENFSKEIALFLKIEFTEPTVGFSHKKPIKRGIFIKKSDEKIFMRALAEFKIHKKIDEIIYAGKNFFSILRKVKRRAEYFFALKKSIN